MPCIAKPLSRIIPMALNPSACVEVKSRRPRIAPFRDTRSLAKSLGCHLEHHLFDKRQGTSLLVALAPFEVRPYGRAKSGTFTEQLLQVVSLKIIDMSLSHGL